MAENKVRMNVRRHMDSMTTVLGKLITENHAEFFIHAEGELILNEKVYKQPDVKITRTYRFEGESDPADQAIIYVIKTSDGGMGYCIDGYGMYSRHTNNLYRDFIQHSRIENLH